MHCAYLEVQFYKQEMCQTNIIKVDGNVIKESDIRGVRRQSLDKALYRATT